MVVVDMPCSIPTTPVTNHNYTLKVHHLAFNGSSRVKPKYIYLENPGAFKSFSKFRRIRMPSSVSKRTNRAEIDRLLNTLPDVSLLTTASGTSNSAVSLPYVAVALHRTLIFRSPG